MEVAHLNQKQLAARWCIIEATMERWRSAGIDKYDKPLAQHLKDSIKHGNEAVYRPEVVVTWEVRLIVNA